MPDQDLIIAEQAERIAKLEEQTRELQQQVKRLQVRGGARRRPKATFWRRLSGAHGELRGVLERVLVALGAFVFACIFVALNSSLAEIIPGGAAFWVPVWWTAVFLLCALSAVLFISSRD